MSDPRLAELIRDSMALVKRVKAGLAASPDGYQPPEETEEVDGK